MTKASTKKGMAGKILAAGCSLALAASLTPAAALTAFAASPNNISVSVVQDDGTGAMSNIITATNVDIEDTDIITPQKAAQSTLYFTPDTSSVKKEGAWSVIAAGKNQVVPFTEIFKSAEGVGVTALSYWQPGAKLEVTGTGGPATFTYEQIQEATNFYPATTEKAINAARAITVTPGIALNATTANIVTSSNAGSVADAIVNNTTLPAGVTTAAVTNTLSIGLSDPNYDVANLAKSVTGVTALKIILPKQEYANVPRIYGEDWSDTMNAVVNKAGFSAPATGPNNFVVASSNNYQDALTASGLAGALKCPLLLTDKDELTQQTADQINGLVNNDGGKVYVIGGPLAVSDAVVTKINQLTGISGRVDNPVVRLAGETAAETSVAVYNQMANLASGTNMGEVVVTTSIAFQDAMSISPYTYSTGTPVVLTGNGNVLDNDALTALTAQVDAKKLDNALILGGNLAVSSSVESQLFGAGLVTVKRIGEATCWETSNAIAEYLTAASPKGIAWSGVASNKLATVATGDNYLDALVASQWCAMQGKQALLLVGNGEGGDYCVTNYVDDTDLSKVYIVGGPQAVSPVIAAQINKAIS